MPLRHDNCTCTVIYECGRMRQDVWSKKTWQASEKELQQRREAAEAVNPVKISPEQAKVINEQSKPRVNTPEQARELEEKMLGRINKNDIDFLGESDKIKVADSSDVYHRVSDDAIDRVPKLDIFEKDEMNVAHQQASKDLLAEVAKHNELPARTEFSIVYDENMNRIPGFGYVQGEVRKTRIDNPGVPFHAFHNHGSNKTFSYTDLLGFARNDKMLSLSAQGNLSSKYVVWAEPQSDREGFRLFLKHKGEEELVSINGKSYTLSAIYESGISNVSDEQMKIILEAVEQKCSECLKEASKYGIKYIGL